MTFGAERFVSIVIVTSCVRAPFGTETDDPSGRRMIPPLAPIDRLDVSTLALDPLDPPPGPPQATKKPSTGTATTKMRLFILMNLLTLPAIGNLWAEGRIEPNPGIRRPSAKFPGRRNPLGSRRGGASD